METSCTVKSQTTLQSFLIGACSRKDSISIRLPNFLSSINFSKFSGISNLKTKHFTFVNLKKGGFQYPHAHNASPSTLTMFFYFVKNWEEGDPGCTYFAKGEDEDNDILVEPYNLDNAMTIFLDADNAWHGVRYIEKDIERQSICVIMERYDEEQKLWDAQIHSK